MRRLDQQKAYDDQLLRNLSNPASYFYVTFKAMDKDGNEVGTVDLTAGILSQYGGFVTVKLNDDTQSLFLKFLLKEMKQQQSLT